MKAIPTSLNGVTLIEIDIYRDSRGSFFENWQKEKYKSLGLPSEWVQDNISESTHGVLRGLHFQNPQPQSKLVQVYFGEVYDVVVDLRRDSSTFGKWAGFYLNSNQKTQLYVPSGCAHGFITISELALFGYKCTDYYAPRNEHCLAWDDPTLRIEWPKTRNLIISEKDRCGKKIQEI